MSAFFPPRLGACLAIVLVAACGAVFAADGAEQPVAYKLTVGLYPQSGGDLPSGPGLDVNLRASSGFGNAWVGWFRSPVEAVSQARAGWAARYRDIKAAHKAAKRK